MQDRTLPGKSAQEDPSGPSAREVEHHLQTILASSAFKASQRSKDFLGFVVERTLKGDTSALHERAIAVDLLGRLPAFDPADDAIVRVQANEVRKRLLRYYESEGCLEPLRIQLPAGGYVPQFERLNPAIPPPPAQLPLPALPPNRRRWWIAAATLLAVAALLFLFRSRPAPIDLFWQPIFSQRNPAIICIPGLRALKPEPGSDLARLLDSQSASPAGEDVFFQPEKIRFHLQDDYVGMGAAVGAIRIATHLSQIAKPAQVRIAQDTSFADLKSHPAILLGAFSSNWTQEMGRDLPFVFVRDQGARKIVEQKPPHRSWSPVGLRMGGRAEDDYAILARLIDSSSGQVIFIAAGFTTFGTQCAAECLADPACVANLASSAPPGWATKNLEAVLHTRILGNTPSPAKLVAIHYW